MAENISTYPPDYASAVGQIRILIGDTEQYEEYGVDGEAAYMFSDSQIQALIALNRDRLKLTAAQLIDSIATNEALVSKKIRTEDLQTDGASVANALRLHAQSLRAEQKADDEEDSMEDSFHIVDMPFSRTYW